MIIKGKHWRELLPGERLAVVVFAAYETKKRWAIK